eukprot:TRINITY_DN5462_c0_g2_i2.p1 TRINITY_DN5462_c0_g2~~TRINITY_DN5462_c0_g2_i2.p1  ORF type:complete len:274 (-),score=70.27 TRINITY_DN5462_c0_g2_i2:68-889(-)
MSPQIPEQYRQELLMNYSAMPPMIDEVVDNTFVNEMEFPALQSSHSAPGGFPQRRPIDNENNNNNKQYSRSLYDDYKGESPLNDIDVNNDMPKSEKGGSEIAEDDPWGLIGLLKILKTSDPDLNMLSSGTDLTTLGLNLSSQGVLYATFASPFAESPLRTEPEYNIPNCYYITPELSPPVHKMGLFSDQTLFYIFYSMAGDSLQMLAAKELLKREWSYHKELKLWVQRMAGTVPSSTNAESETGNYVYWNTDLWKQSTKLNFTIGYDKMIMSK